MNMIYNIRKLIAPKYIADGFANYISSVYKPSTSKSTSCFNHTHSNFVSLNLVTLQQIASSIGKLKSNGTAEPNLVRNFIIQDCIFFLKAYSLFSIFH